MKYILLLICITSLFACQQPQADLIIKNAKIYTVNNQFDTASVMVIKDGKFIAIGNEQLLSQFKADSMLDAEGQYIYPGFILQVMQKTNIN